MKVLVFELNSFHVEVLPTYPALMPSLFGDRLDIDYFVLPALVKRARAAIGANVHRLNSPHLRYVLPTKPLRVGYYRWRIQRIIDQLCPDAIVFNTVEPPTLMSVEDTRPKLLEWLRLSGRFSTRAAGVGCS